MDIENYRYVDGLWMHKMFPEENLRSAFAYTPRPNDIFLVTYPKCGTTWTQYLVLSILRKGNPPKTSVDIFLSSPFLEMTGSEGAEKMVRPGILKTHLPFSKVPYSANAKYIYVARNPYDACVSLYYQVKGSTPKSVTDVSFATFQELFLTGKLSWGDYFDHLIPWYEHRDSPNVLFFTYEMLKKDTGLWMQNMADFLGEEYGNELRRDSTLRRKVLDACSLENMKSLFNEDPAALFKDMLCLPPEKALKSFEVFRNIGTQIEEFHESERLIRKGVVGDWRNHFTPEQVEKTKAWIKKKTEGSGVMELWNDTQLP